MIVVHPEDPSTRMLSLIYEGLADVTIFNSWQQRKEILNVIEATPKEEPIFLLGHGSSSGLLDKRFGFIIRDEDADLLKNRPNLVGIWCYASDFAYRHGLKGFFSGMFISEFTEALHCKVNTNTKEIEDKAFDFAFRFGNMLSMGIPLNQIVEDLTSPCHHDSELTSFNYSRLTWRPTGKESSHAL